MKIMIITGANRDVQETGFGSIQSCEHVLEALVTLGYSATIKECQTQYDLNLVIKAKPDLVILAVKNITIENKKIVWLADFFHSNDINYTGSSKDVLNLDSSKISVKLLLQDSGIQTANFFTAIPREYKSVGELPLKFPLFLKPSNSANGNGIDDLSFVSDFESFEKKVLSLYLSFSKPVLVEEYLDGREFTVAIIENKENSLVVSAVEIIPPESSKGLRILGARTRNENSEVLLKVLDNDLLKQIKDLAISSFKKLGGRDFGRIDIKLNKNNECFFMNADLLPGMASTASYFPRAYNLELAIDYDEVIKLIISQGINRVPLQTRFTL